MNKVLSIILCLVVIFSASTLVFADDDESSISESSEVLSSDLPEDADIRAIATDIYNIMSDNGTRATPKTLDDVYSLIYNIFYNTSGGSAVNEIVTIRQRVNSILTLLQTTDQTISDIYSCINADYDTTGISIYDQLASIIIGLFTIDPDDGDLSISETLVYIYSELEDLHTYLYAFYTQFLATPNLTQSQVTTAINNAVNNHLTNIEDWLSGIRSVLLNIRSDIQSYLTTTNSTLSSLLTELQNYHNDYNNISWSNGGSFMGMYSELGGSTITSIPNTGGDFYFVYLFNNPASSPYLYKVTFPFGSANTNFDFTYNLLDIYQSPDNLTYYAYTFNGKYWFEHTKRAPSLIIDSTFNSTNTFNNIYYAFKIHIPSSTYWSYNANLSSLTYLNSTNIDYFTVYNHYLFDTLYSIANTFKSIYASDDLIAAKQAQQGLEDQIISDFTGNGSASVSIGDAINAKQASNAIKSGLNTGIASSYALSVFDNDSSLYIWFSQSVADWFTVPQTTRGQGSVNNQDYSNIIWSDDITDLITSHDNEYNSYIQ